MSFEQTQIDLEDIKESVENVRDFFEQNQDVLDRFREFMKEKD